MIKWLGAAGGAELAIIGALGAALIFAGGVYKGTEWEKNAEASRQLEQKQELDGKSTEVSLDVDGIAKDLGDKIDGRIARREAADVEEIAKSAKTVGRLEGEADGYIRGFKDAENKLKNTCYTDPAFLSDSMRRDAESRYRAIFRSEGAPEQSPSPDGLSDSPLNDAPN